MEKDSYGSRGQSVETARNLRNMTEIGKAPKMQRRLEQHANDAIKEIGGFRRSSFASSLRRVWRTGKIDIDAQRSRFAYQKRVARLAMKKC